MHASTTLAASAVISARPGALLGVLLTAGADAASVTIYDNATTNSGTVLAVVKAAINSTAQWTPHVGQVCANGLYAAVSGTTPSATVVYR
jgi:hypothetical protein